MEETNYSNFEVKEKLPNATPVIILGVLSLFTCCFYGIGAILGGIGFYLANKDIKLYNENPDRYSNINNVKTGKVLCIIGIALGVLYFILLAWVIGTFGWDAMQDPELLKERMNEYFGQ